MSASKVISFPCMGDVSRLIASSLAELGWQIKETRNTSASLAKGNRYLDELICLPARLTLGNLIEAAETGATDVVQFDSCGLCRMKAYWVLQKEVLRKLGFKTQVHPLRLGIRTPGDLKRIDPSLPLWQAWYGFIRAVRQVMATPWQPVQDNSGRLNIGIIGEIYTILEPFANNRLFERLGKMGCFIHNSMPIKYFVGYRLYHSKREDMLPDKLVEAEHVGHLIFPKNIGGHGNDSIAHLVYYALAGYDGVIHVMPFPCMPEATVKPVLLELASRYKIPFMSLTFDGQASETGYITRLEAFVDMLKRRKIVG